MVWAVCVLLLIYWTASNLLWQTMFFALAAALTWMAGSMLSSWGAAAEALRLFGGAAVFGVLLEGSWSSVWKGISGNWTLWILFFVILAIDAVLLTRMGIKRDRLAALGGLTPFIMLVAASLAVLKQPVCLLLSLYPSLPRFLPWQLSGGGIGAIPTC